MAAVSRSAIRLEYPSTLVGLAALSVEMLTNTSTPSVPGRLQHVCGAQDVGLPGLVRVLLQHRQVLERRRVEHHLRPVPAENLAQGLGSRMSASTTSSVSSSARPVMLSCSACSADSSRSSMSSFSGPNRTSWRHNSDPIDPPAPVTRTRLPSRYPAHASTSVSTGSRPRRSVTSMSRRSCRPTRPEKMFLRVGSTLTFRPTAAADSETSRNNSDRADGMAMIRTSAPVRSAADLSAVRFPRTGMPSICRCRFSGSSSSSPTGT